MQSVAFTGRACAGAMNAVFCDQQLVMLRDQDLPCPSNDCGTFVLTTMGDEVTRIEETSALRALIGSVDSESEAVIVAALAGLEVRCPESGSRELSGTQVRATGDGYQVRTDWEQCGEGLWRDSFEVSTNATTSEMTRESLGMSNCVIGRVPAGLRACAPLQQGTALGKHLAAAARLEAASVYAFERLARELGDLGAPAELVAGCLRSALDEVRHARGVAALAARYGAQPAPVSLAPIAERGRLDLALENAVEGCVRETFGAVVAHCQAMTATDPDVRALMQQIAEDESRHARLSWQIAGWLEPRLSEPERVAVNAARQAALLALYGELQSELPPADQQRIGLPTPAVARAMLDGLARLV